MSSHAPPSATLALQVSAPAPVLETVRLSTRSAAGAPTWSASEGDGRPWGSRGPRRRAGWARLLRLMSSPAPPSATLALQVSAPAPVLETVRLSTRIAAGALPWSASVADGGAWLDITPKSGPTPARVQVRLDPNGLAPGAYHGTVVVSAGQAGGGPAPLPVGFVVAGGAGLAPPLPADTTTG